MSLDDFNEEKNENEEMKENEDMQPQEEERDENLERYLQKQKEREHVFTVIPDEPAKETKKKNELTGVVCLFLILSILLSAVSSVLAVKYVLSKQPNQTQIVINEVGSTNTHVSTVDADVSGIVSQIENTVVEVYTESVAYSMFYGSYITEGAGSGVIFTEDGYIITNNHVIENARSIHVKLHNGEEYPATLIGADAQSDLALLKIEKTGLQAAVLGNSDTLKVGEPCIAIGNPLGTLGGTVTTGIISALSRSIKIDNQTMTLLQTNTAINPGNSGGGLFDYSGNLIGIVNAKSSGENIEGIGFAIPVNDCREIIVQLLQYGYVIGRPMLGIRCTSIDSVQTAYQHNLRSYGVLVEELLSDEAKESDLEVGDLIIGLDNITISSTADLQTALLNYNAGDQVQLTVLRENRKMMITLKLCQKKNYPSAETGD